MKNHYMSPASLTSRMHAVATALVVFLLSACEPMAMAQVESDFSACGAGKNCPNDEICEAEICVPNCIVAGTCDDAGAAFDAGCTAAGTCDDAGVVFDAGCTSAGTCDDAGVVFDAGCAATGTCDDASLAGGRTCDDDPCFDGVTCTDVTGGQGGADDDLFICGACPSGYTGDGVTCTDIDGCANSPCFANVTCSDVAAAAVAAVGAEYTCGACPSGYTGNGNNCTDVNECASNPCNSNQTCSNTVGSYTCVDNVADECTTWDYSANAPCPSGYYNCDCLNHCGATSPCDTTTDPTWPPTDADEIGNYHGRYNGDRPTWYFGQLMSAYPDTFTVVVVGCATFQVTGNNGTRFEGYSGYLVKQSDVAGRGMAVIAPSSCMSQKCYIRW